LSLPGTLTGNILIHAVVLPFLLHRIPRSIRDASESASTMPPNHLSILTICSVNLGPEAASEEGILRPRHYLM
jgi:hypothetical protein